MLEVDQSHAEIMNENTYGLSGVGGLNGESSESHAGSFRRIRGDRRGEGKGKHTPLLGVCGVCARTSADSRNALLFAGSLLRVVPEQADVDSATRGEKTWRTDVQG